MKNYLENYSASVVVYDEIDRYDGSGRYRKGTPKDYEVERFQEYYGIDISYMKKSDFPIEVKFKSGIAEKISGLEDFEVDGYPVSIYRKKGLKRGHVCIHMGNDNEVYVIAKNKVEDIKKMNFKEFDKYLR